MKTILLILVLLFGGMSTLYARFKRTLAEDGDPSDGSETQSYGRGTAERDFFDFDNDEAEEVNVQAQPEYFTYENPDVDVKHAPVAVQQEEPEMQMRPQFDLRQAVIYQTLLNNRYITNLEK